MRRDLYHKLAMNRKLVMYYLERTYRDKEMPFRPIYEDFILDMDHYRADDHPVIPVVGDTITLALPAINDEWEPFNFMVSRRHITSASSMARFSNPYVPSQGIQMDLVPVFDIEARTRELLRMKPDNIVPFESQKGE